MITTEITIRRGTKTFNQDGLETGWSEVVARTGTVASEESDKDHDIECKLKAKELLHTVDVELAWLAAKVEVNPDLPCYIGTGFDKLIEQSKTDG